MPVLAGRPLASHVEASDGHDLAELVDNFRQGLLVCLDRMAVNAGSEQQFERVVHLYTVADALRELHAMRDLRTPAACDVERALLEAAYARLGRRSAEAIAHSARAVAQRFFERTRDGVLRGLLEHADSERPSSVGPMLTAREWDVAMLVAEGKTNPQIAEELVISRGTVMTHVKHILHRLGMCSRTQIAAWVAQQKLIAA